MELKILRNKKEKEEFLENDLIDRLIRVEQKVSARFGKFTGYKDTYCYKSLSPKNREAYEKYLKDKGKKRVVFSSIFLAPLLALFFLSNNLTGNVVKESVGDAKIFNGIYFFFLILVISIFCFGLIFLFYIYQRKKRFEPLFKILERIGKKKSF